MAAAGKANIGIIGVGSFTQGMILPALKKAGAHVSLLAGSQGANAAITGARFGIGRRTTDSSTVFADPAINAVIVGTRHDSHAEMVLRSLDAGKHVLVEKPLCLTEAQLNAIAAKYDAAKTAGGAPIIMVGFNRRFAPMTQKLAGALRLRTAPLFLDILCNAGTIADTHWIHDPVAGGGRVLGEACHFIDLFRYLAASPIVSVRAAFAGEPAPSNDVIAITLTAADGSIGQVNYVSSGSKQFPKERVTAIWGGKTAEISNFTSLKGYGVSISSKAWRQDKGHNASFAAFVEAVEKGSASPIPFDEIVNVTKATFAAVEAALTGKTLSVSA
jgi:predicted dehydrogenase